MQVGIAYSESVQQIWLTIEVPDDATAHDAIERSGILKMFPHIDLATQKVGVNMLGCRPASFMTTPP